MTSCSQPSGYTSDNTDCDDNDNDIFPGAPELCNGVDDNCDQTVDEDTATDAATWYLDNDSDGYGDFNSSTMACAQPTGYVSDSTDCNDTDGAISPIAVETCDGIDNMPRRCRRRRHCQPHKLLPRRRPRWLWGQQHHSIRAIHNRLCIRQRL